MSKFFQGWYFKCSTANKTIAFIPAVHDNGTTRSVSLQIITDKGAFSVTYPTIAYDRLQNSIKLGNNIFSPRGIHLSILEEEIQVTGSVHFSSPQKISGDIMGPFHYIPFMQCQHKVYSMMHKIEGKINVNGKDYTFSDGIGYLEGDRGYSFPKKYLWTQCHFKGGSLMLSVADIPMPGFHFTGIISTVMVQGKEYRLATYSGARIEYKGNHSISIRQGDLRLSAKLIKQNDFSLHAPHKGDMTRLIRESPTCTAQYRFSCGNTVLLHFQSNMASFEYEYP